jgi:DNA polymerase-3 subunit epsilon
MRRLWRGQVPAGPFVALDFETADYGSDSACALSMIRVNGDAIVDRQTRLIRPPRPSFSFSYIHGITWRHVKDQPTFAELWPTLAPMLDGAAFVAAHNASFDRRVMQACCTAAGLTEPAHSWMCTVMLSRRTFPLRSHKLPDVAAHIGFALRHHDPESDAEACARIVIAARSSLAPVVATGSVSDRSQ